MKIVVLDSFTLNPGDLSWSELEKMGEFTSYEYTNSADVAEVVERIGDAEVVLTNKTIISAEVMEKCPDMKYIGVLATGYNVVDIPAAKAKEITVTNVPAYGTDTVAQFTMGLLLEICHHVGHHAQTVQDGRWSKSRDFCYWDYPMIELAGKTMGIIGFGRIGQSVARMAKAFGMKIISYHPKKIGTAHEWGEYVDLDTLFAESDVISLHCPLNDGTKEIIRSENIDKMKDGVIILNSGRGPLINEKDLREALESGKVKAAGLDVVSVEPIKEDNPLLGAPNVLITPHIAWAAKEARQRLLTITENNVRAYMEDAPINVVS